MNEKSIYMVGQELEVLDGSTQPPYQRAHACTREHTHTHTESSEKRQKKDPSCISEKISSPVWLRNTIKTLSPSSLSHLHGHWVLEDRTGWEQIRLTAFQVTMVFSCQNQQFETNLSFNNKKQSRIEHGRIKQKEKRKIMFSIFSYVFPTNLTLGRIT